MTLIPSSATALSDYNGDGPATSVELTNPAGVFVDPPTGNLWIADYWSNRVRMYNASSKTITTVVGSGAVGDGGLATSASLYYPRNPALDANGNLFFVDAQNNRIREISAAGQTIPRWSAQEFPARSRRIRAVMADRPRPLRFFSRAPSRSKLPAACWSRMMVITEFARWMAPRESSPPSWDPEISARVSLFQLRRRRTCA